MTLQPVANAQKPQRMNPPGGFLVYYAFWLGLQLAPASSCPATQLAPMTCGQSSQAATSSSGQVSAVARAGQRGRAVPASGSGSRPSSGAPFHQFNVQHQHHQHLHQNAQHNSVNAIDPQQLEDMVNSLVAARVEASLLQMQGRVKEAMNQLEVQHQERLVLVQEERNACTDSEGSG